MYYSSDKLVKDIFKLKDTIIFVTDMVEYELSTLDTMQYQFLKHTLNKNNVKVVVIKRDVDKKIRMIS